MARHNSMHLKIHASDVKTKTLEPSAVSIPWTSRQCVPMSLKRIEQLIKQGRITAHDSSIIKLHFASIHTQTPPPLSSR